MVDPRVSNARGDVGGECMVVVEEIQAGTRWVLCLPFQDEISFPIAASSCEVGREGGDSRDVELAQARHRMSLRALPCAKPERRQKPSQKTAVQVCDKKSAYSCACSPWVRRGINPRDAMVVWSDRQGGRCMVMQRAGEKPVQKRRKATREAWRTKTPSFDNTAQVGAEGSSSRPHSG